MDSEFVKKRLEKDLQELKKMIEKHFEQRKKDEEDISELESRIEKRKEARAKQIEERAKVLFDRIFDVSGFRNTCEAGVSNQLFLFRELTFETHITLNQCMKSIWPQKQSFCLSKTPNQQALFKSYAQINYF